MEIKEIKAPAFKGYALINGLKMYYEIHGTGRIPLVLIHGGGSTIETTFATVLPLLSENHRVIAVELQAHGHSGDRDSAVSFEQDADDVAGLLEYLEISKADFFGFSNGGNTAMQIAIRHSPVVNKLVIASSFYKREGMIEGFFEGMKDASLQNMPMPLQSAYLKVAPDKTRLQGMHDNDKQRMLTFKDWPDENMRSIQMPTLFITGDHDVVRIEHVVEMFHLLPHAQLAVLPGGHGTYIGEIMTPDKTSKMPALAVAMIEEFLSEKSGE